MSARNGCATPIPWEQLVAYWTGELDDSEVDGLDEHLVGCATCSAESARVTALTQALQELVPPVIDHAALAALHARGHQIRDNVIQPNDRHVAVFGAGTEFLIHRLRIDLSLSTTVGVTVTVEETGAVLLHEPSVAFDRDTGEVLIACQRHFQAFPPNIVIEVCARDPAGGELIGRFAIPHVFEVRAGA